MNEIEFFSDDTDIVVEEYVDEKLIFKDIIESFSSKLKLSNDELNLISSIARERKFVLSKADSLYPKEYITKCQTFIFNFRFLKSISNSIDEDNELLCLKLKMFISTYEKLYFQLLDLYTKSQSHHAYGTTLIKKQIENILYENEEKINLFIDCLYNIGKIVSQYDPNEEIGIQ